MTDFEKELLIKYDEGGITREVLLGQFPVNLRKDGGYIVAEMQAAIQSADPEEINRALLLIWLSGNVAAFTDLLNELLLNPNHNQHQVIAKNLQSIKSPSTIPFVERVLATHFDYLAYTCSESGAIAKWFSWLLYEIGTPEAIAVLKRYATDPDEGIQKEMLYRLERVRQSQ
jgi:hypothetical protein